MRHKEPEKPLEMAVQELDGMTSEGIAKLMARRKVHGRPCTKSQCPLANLMHAIYGGKYLVGRKFIMRRQGGNGLRSSWAKVKTPEGLSEFIQAFDLGRYPSLISPPPRAFGPRKRYAPTGKKSPKVNHPALEVGR